MDKVILFVMSIGSLFGALFLHLNFDVMEVDIEIGANLVTFFELFLKNGKYIVILWLLGFFKFGYVFIFLVLFIKSFFIGFTTSFMLNKFGMLGVKYILDSYFLQMIAFVPLLIYISKCAIYKNVNANNMKTFDIIKYYKQFFLAIIINIIITLTYLLKIS